MARVFIPPPLRQETGGCAELTLEGANVRQIVVALEERFPDLVGRLRQGDTLVHGLAVAVDGAIAPLGLREPVQPSSEIHFLPALAGGSR